MATVQTVSEARVRRQVAAMLAGQRMASAEPSAADLEIARRHAAGRISAEQAVAEAIGAARASVARS